MSGKLEPLSCANCGNPIRNQKPRPDRKRRFCCLTCYHASLLTPRVDEATRFWIKVKKTETCWLWIGRTTPKGYGRFDAGSGRKDHHAEYAHRFVFTLARTPLLDSEEGDHFCPNKNCVRIHADHVRRVPRFHNHDSPAHINRIKTHCIHGHEFKGTNLRIDKNGARSCVICKTLYQRPVLQ